MLENCIQLYFNLEVGRCGRGSGQTNDDAACDYSERSREPKTNGVRRQNALSAYSYPVLPYRLTGHDFGTGAEPIVLKWPTLLFGICI